MAWSFEVVEAGVAAPVGLGAVGLCRAAAAGDAVAGASASARAGSRRRPVAMLGPDGLLQVGPASIAAGEAVARAGSWPGRVSVAVGEAAAAGA